MPLDRPRTLASFFDGAAIPGALLVLGALVAGVGIAMGRARSPWLGAALIGLGMVLDLAVGKRALRPWLGMVATTAQLGLILKLIEIYKLESVALYELLAPTIFFGFIAHHYLSIRVRPAFFLLISLAAIGQVLGLRHGLLLVGAGSALLAICHIPIRLGVRVGLLVLVSGALAAFRVGWLASEDLGVILPILSSMFMFRLVIYLYDIHHNKGPKDLSTRLSYFFMLPNVVFPFFPVVDYSTYGRTYYNQPALRIYQKGLLFIFAGALHLILYRIDNYYVAMNPEQVTGFGSFLVYIVSNFGLYLRISGLFHVIIGIMHLFGYNLPDTHTGYYLSFSFVEFWRRINIYWKDFMQKLIFQPTFMALKKRNVEYMTSIVASMLVVFFLTWVLHAYQWFWLRGTVLFTAPDMLFWGVLAVLLVIQTWRDASVAEKKGAGSGRALLGPRAFLVVRTVASMLTICVLWALWSAQSFSAWLSLMLTAAGGPPSGPLGWLTVVGFVLLILFMGALTLGYTFGLGSHAGPGLAKKKKLKKSKNAPAYGTAVAGSLGALALVMIQQPLVYAQMDGGAQKIVLAVRSAKLSARENAAMVQGYYENLTDVRLINSQLWEVHLNKPKDWKQIGELHMVRHIPGWLDFGLQPNSSEEFKGVNLSTNRWGYRDKDYEKVKPDDTYRIALIGASRAMGSGVAVQETFAWRIEERLNGTQGDHRFKSYEVINFSIASYEQVRRLMVLEQEVLDFQPDAALWVAADNDLNLWQFTEKYLRGMEPPYPELKDIAERAGLALTMDKTEVARRLEPFRDEIVGWTYGRFVQSCRAKGVRPIYVMVPEPTEAEGTDERMALAMGLAKDAGFDVLDLTPVYRGQALPELWIAEWDHHPNAKGHLLIEAALYDALLGHPTIAKDLRLDGANRK